jgi:transposase
MSNILRNVSKKHASEDVVYHCLYMFYFLGVRKSRLAKLFHKDVGTISCWITRFEEAGYYSRKKTRQIARKFDDEMQQWIVDLYKANPVLFLEEAKEKFEKQFQMKISISSICLILHKAGFSYKVLERRAIQVTYSSISRFHEEISSIAWIYSMLLFLDEVSFDSRGMLRSRGYGIRGERLIFRGEFIRRPRESFLCFLGETGIIESYSTEGTFTRQKFFQACKDMALGGKVQQYPGKHSIWILDGARIHCDPEIIYYLRSLGIFPIFLPAYCPFLNPIEIIFGLIKKYLKKTYVENSKKSLHNIVVEALMEFESFRATNLFRKCGYMANGTFNAGSAMGQSAEDIGFKKQ